MSGPSNLTPGEQGNVVETPLVESERESLRAWSGRLPHDEWAFGVLVDSALWTLEQVEAERDRLAEEVERITSRIESMIPVGGPGEPVKLTAYTLQDIARQFREALASLEQKEDR